MYQLKEIPNLGFFNKAIILIFTCKSKNTLTDYHKMQQQYDLFLMNLKII